MKNLTKNMTIAAAALVVAAGVAQAQTIKVEVPFSFRAGGTVMPAGEYRVNARYSNGGIRVVQLTNTDMRHSTLAMPFQTKAPKPGSPEAGKPRSIADLRMRRRSLHSGPTGPRQRSGV